MYVFYFLVMIRTILLLNITFAAPTNKTVFRTNVMYDWYFSNATWSIQSTTLSRITQQVVACSLSLPYVPLCVVYIMPIFILINIFLYLWLILFNFDQMIILFIENIKSLMHLYFFALPLKTKRKLFAPFTRMLILITANSGNCLYSANTISNVRSCGDGLPKNQKPKEAKIHFITNKIVRS